MLDLATCHALANRTLVNMMWQEALNIFEVWHAYHALWPTMTKLSPLQLHTAAAAAAAAKSLQSCPTLRDPIDGSPSGSPIPGILQARTLEWVAISFSNAWKWKVKLKSLSRVRPSATPRTATYQAPPPMGFCRQEYWSGVPLPSPNYTLGYINTKQNWQSLLINWVSQLNLVLIFWTKVTCRPVSFKTKTCCCKSIDFVDGLLYSITLEIANRKEKGREKSRDTHFI